ncbi:MULTISPECIES: iron chelate uptake ABC transporter family permease subunit [unclassified Rhodococcus (in: high G+C Gram-positive bacteria)]|uniref:iron chelate uptake ABC transporter family permease subunit n=1 Tax=Rhodococcus sp. YL-0 TaxID=1930581 RepID=UPI000A615143|nr:MULTISPECIES: iron chelate uptake ABC transporter family permease subunit [unclassified Rhodococcus (in: high G+C Gram-positive bacteria)]
MKQHTDPRSDRRTRVLVVLAVIAVAVVCAYMFLFVTGSWNYAMKVRTRQVLSMILVGYATAFAAVIFQTITNNRILTPSVMGFDSLFMLIQTIIVFFFGAGALTAIDPRAKFGVEVLVMIVFALVLYWTLFGRESGDLYVLVLVGIVLGSLFAGLSSLASRLIDPNDFITLQDILFASFNTVHVELLGVSAICVAAATAFSLPLLRQLDVVALGREHAVNLGIEHRKVLNRTLIVIAVLVSVSTALVGPITFLGLLVANLAREITGTFRHRWTIPAAVLLSIIALVGGQFVLARLLDFNSSLIVVINFVGGIYFISLLVRGAKL